MFIDILKNILAPLCVNKNVPSENESHEKREFALNPSPSMDPAAFEQLWSAGSVIGEWSDSITVQRRPDEVEQMLGKIGIQCLASGVVEGIEKFFFFAESSTTPTLFLLEVSFETDQEEYSVIIKAASAESINPIVEKKMVDLVGVTLEEIFN